jgi:hypothetical protein
MTDNKDQLLDELVTSANPDEVLLVEMKFAAVEDRQ